MKRKILLLFMLGLINIPLASSQGSEFERNALLLEGDKYSIQIAIEFRKLVINAGYNCDRISVYIPMTHRDGAKIQCNEFTDIYVILRNLDEEPQITHVQIPDFWE